MNGSNTLLALVSVLVAATTGCNATRPGAEVQSLAPDSSRASYWNIAHGGNSAKVIRASLAAPIPAGTISAANHQEQSEGTRQTLSLEALVADVLARNPSLAQMTAAWQAASARYPQVRSWDDPMLSGMVAPASFGSNVVDSAYRVEISQKIPIPGKLRLRGQGALAEASAAGSDVEDMRVQLVESTKVAFYDYYLVGRAVAVNQESLDLLKQFRENADFRFKTGLVPQQDILQADVEIGRQQERGVTLERMRKVAIARINTLRNGVPDEPLALPPEELAPVGALPDVEKLRGMALGQRPDLKALEDRIAAEKTAVALAFKDYWPEVEMAGAYDTIMGNGP
jgi:outer membrane protein, heavy metal efflux system